MRCLQGNSLSSSSPRHHHPHGKNLVKLCSMALHISGDRHWTMRVYAASPVAAPMHSCSMQQLTVHGTQAALFAYRNHATNKYSSYSHCSNSCVHAYN
jgi:hypothetical protein